MAGIAVSGTLVGAVLETAGYLAQEQILSVFGRFFQSVGVLLFILAAVGAVVSVALFGSYRTPRYILVGPILFYFLTAVTTETEGVAWQLGGGTPRTQSGFVKTPQESSAAVTALATDSPGETKRNIRSDPSIQVSWVFKTFTTLISQVANALTDLILQHENDQNLIGIARTRALESLADPSIANGRLLNMIQGDLLVKCNAMFAASQELSSPFLGFRREASLKRSLEVNVTNADQANQRQLLEAITARRIQLEEMIKKAGGVWINPTEATRSFMATQFASDSATQQIMKERNAPNLSALLSGGLTCRETWRVTADAIQQYAGEFISDWENLYSKELPADERRKLLCADIAQKIGRQTTKQDPTGGDLKRCDLVDVASIFILRKAIRQSSTSQLVSRLQNDMQFISSVKRGDIRPLDSAYDRWLLVGGPVDYETKVEGGKWKAVFENPDDPGQRLLLEIAELNQISGDKDVALIEHQQLQAREVRQKIFTISMLLPQLQGLLLYLLSIAYPFLAILVVLPGRAAAFLNFFLLWMWVKSWGVCFAMVLVLDQVLWNLFPTYDFDQFNQSNAKLSEQPLSVVLSEAFSMDPTFHTHAYYFFLSLAMFSIPILTGFAFLKGKDAVLSSFVDGIVEQGDDAAKRLEGAFGIVANNLRMQGFAELDSMAVLGRGYRGEGLEGAGRGQASHFWGQLATAGQVAAASTTGGSLLTSYSAAKLGSVARLVDNQMSFLRGYLDTDTGYARAYDQQYGRWGRYQLMADAAAAALDGDGGFEINNNITTDWISPHVSLFTQKIMALNTYGVDLQAMGAGITTRIPILGELMRLNAAAPGLAELQNWLESNGKIVDGEAKAAAFNEKFFSSRAVSDAQALSNSLGISPMLFRRIWDIDDFNNIIRAPLPKPTEEPDLRRYDPPGSTPPVQDPPPGGRL